MTEPRILWVNYYQGVITAGEGADDEPYIQAQPVAELLERLKPLLSNLRAEAKWHPDSLRETFVEIEALLAALRKHESRPSP